MSKITPNALESVVARSYGPTQVTNLKRVTGGASRETWLFDSTSADTTEHRLVLRRDPAPSIGATGRETEFELLAAVRRAGVPVPQVRLLLETADGLGSGFIMDRIEGETIPRKLLRDEMFTTVRPQLTAQFGSIAAQIHAVPVSSLPKLKVETARTQLDQWTEILDMFREPHPALEFGLQWMRERVPPESEPPRLVHGDFRNGNFMVGPEGVRCVLDWELAHLGDPIEDLGWLCARAWRFGVNRVVGGFGDVSDLLDAYEAASGTRPRTEDLQFWIALATHKWAVMCLIQTFTHIRGAVRSVELAAIGRRVVENEWDLLNLIDGTW